MTIEREALAPLVARLNEPRRFLQVVAGPRQVGKTTLVRQALERLQQEVQPMAQPTWLEMQSVTLDVFTSRGI